MTDIMTKFQRGHSHLERQSTEGIYYDFKKLTKP